MTDHRVSRGRATQQMLADWFNKRGWRNVQSRPASLPGVDLMGMDGLAPEVKATAKGDLTGALRQAVKNSGPDLPFVLYRPNGYGPERIAEWLAVFRLADATVLLRKAGFGG